MITVGEVRNLNADTDGFIACPACKQNKIHTTLLAKLTDGTVACVCYDSINWRKRMGIRHKRIIEMEFSDNTDDLIDMNHVLDILAEDGIDIEVNSEDEQITKVKVVAYDDLLTDSMRETLDMVSKHITQSILVSDDI